MSKLLLLVIWLYRKLALQQMFFFKKSKHRYRTLWLTEQCQVFDTIFFCIANLCLFMYFFTCCNASKKIYLQDPDLKETLLLFYFLFSNNPNYGQKSDKITV